MLKPWDFTMAQAMLMLKKDTLPPPGREALEHVIPLLHERPKDYDGPNRYLKFLWKKFLAWYDTRDSAALLPGAPETVLIDRIREVCGACGEDETWTNAKEDELLSSLLQAVESYRKQVEIPVSGDRIVRLKYPSVQKEIMKDHGIDVHQYFFDPGQHKAEIARAADGPGEQALQRIYGRRELAFRATCSYLRERISLYLYSFHIEDWPRSLVRALEEERRGYTDDFLRKLAAEGEAYLKESGQGGEETAKIRFDQELARLFLAWATVFEQKNGMP